eukprot:scaffold33434_cov71-Phaeocystis_antarctica.AAC.4
MYALAVSVDSTGAANATKRDFLMSSSLVTWRCSVVMPARPAVVRARRLPARVRVHLALKRRIWRSNVATQAGWSSDLCGGGPSTRGGLDATTALKHSERPPSCLRLTAHWRSTLTRSEEAEELLGRRRRRRRGLEAGHDDARDLGEARVVGVHLGRDLALLHACEAHLGARGLLLREERLLGAERRLAGEVHDRIGGLMAHLDDLIARAGRRLLGHRRDLALEVERLRLHTRLALLHLEQGEVVHARPYLLSSTFRMSTGSGSGSGSRASAAFCASALPAPIESNSATSPSASPAERPNEPSFRPSLVASSSSIFERVSSAFALASCAASSTRVSSCSIRSCLAFAARSAVTSAAVSTPVSSAALTVASSAASSISLDTTSLSTTKVSAAAAASSLSRREMSAAATFTSTPWAVFRGSFCDATHARERDGVESSGCPP